jgi:hypothetical protein
MPTGIEREVGGKPSMRQLFIGPSLIPAAVGLRPSPHATVRGGLELFGDNCATNNQTPPVGVTLTGVAAFSSPVFTTEGSGLVDLSLGVTISNTTVQDSRTTTWTSGPRLSAHGTPTAAWVTGGVFEFQNRPCVTGSTGCGRGNQLLSQGLWRNLGRG